VLGEASTATATATAIDNATSSTTTVWLDLSLCLSRFSRKEGLDQMRELRADKMRGQGFYSLQIFGLGWDFLLCCVIYYTRFQEKKKHTELFLRKTIFQ
jgi:amino acid permease